MQDVGYLSVSIVEYSNISVVDMLGALGELFCGTKKALHVKDEFGIQDLDDTDNTQVCLYLIF